MGDTCCLTSTLGRWSSKFVVQDASSSRSRSMSPPTPTISSWIDARPIARCRTYHRTPLHRLPHSPIHLSAAPELVSHLEEAVCQSTYPPAYTSKKSTRGRGPSKG